MYSTVYSGGICGIRCFLAKVEVDMAKSLPSFDMVGKLSKEVTEAKERIKVALKNSGIDLKPTHITVNISPADIPKRGTAFDLPIAIGILAAQGFIHESLLTDTCIVGELGLDGSVCPVKGVLPIMLEAKKQGMKNFIIPYDNRQEASYIRDVTIFGVKDFCDALAALTSDDASMKVENKSLKALSETSDTDLDFSDVIGQDSCKRAALIAAAGFHHMIISGPPGSGKTMIASRMPSIMPALTDEECMEVSSIYSIAGKLSSQKPVMIRRPFQSPHHSTTLTALTGGGKDIRPGMISLSHKGILFMDEMPEFSKECIEALREPLENRSIQISRFHDTYEYPADFLLIGAANPCPCGFYPDRNRCECTESEIHRYQSRLSGPIKDRIDLIVTANKVDMNSLMQYQKGIDSKTMRSQVKEAHKIQLNRYKGTEYRFNSQVSAKDMKRFFKLGKEELEYMEKAYSALDLSARSYHKVLKVARTIADLEKSDMIRTTHLAEAMCYRG